MIISVVHKDHRGIFNVLSRKMEKHIFLEEEKKEKGRQFCQFKTGFGV